MSILQQGEQMKNKLKVVLPYVSAALFGLFIFSLGSDVWEGYAFIFGLSLIANYLVRRP